MKKEELKCAICSGNLIVDQEKDTYVCKDCGAAHSAEMFKVAEEGKKKFTIKRIRILIAILAALYLLFILSWRARYFS